MITDAPSQSISHRKRANLERLIEDLDLLCATMQPGEMVPTHRELMRRYDASERAVLRALDELQRHGKIVRYQGKGTFIAERHGEKQEQTVVPAAIADSKTIVAIMRPDHSFFDQCLEILFHQARAANMAVACRLVDNDDAWRPGLLAPEHQPAGFIVFSARLAPIAHHLHAAGSRVVVVGQPLPDHPVDVPCVYGDQEQGGYLAMRHLLELGHRRIAYCGFTGTDGLRGVGHERAIREWKLRSATSGNQGGRYGGRAVKDDTPIQISEIPHNVIYDWMDNPRLAVEFFSSPEAPTGLLTWNDQRALEALRPILRAGIRVPEQVSLIGYDALQEGQMALPALTTLSTQIEQQVQVAVNLLTRPVPPPANHSVVLMPSLVTGESAAKPRRP